MNDDLERYILRKLAVLLDIIEDGSYLLETYEEVVEVRSIMVYDLMQQLKDYRNFKNRSSVPDNLH